MRAMRRTLCFSAVVAIGAGTVARAGAQELPAGTPAGAGAASDAAPHYAPSVPPVPPPPVKLGDAVARAMARNPTALVATEEIRRARAIVEEVRAGAFPTLLGNAAYTRLDADRIVSDRVARRAP
jgi:outer membrane protein TolC